MMAIPKNLMEHSICKQTIYVFLLLILSLNVNAQFYNTGQDRGSLKWKQINTEKFRLVYPQFAEKKAQNFANKLLWASQNVGKGLDSTTSKIDIIMHMESSTSNAMVVWAPKRMEVHSLNSQNSYAQEWFEQLALHEYRHVVQIDKLNEGFTKVISIVFGEMGTSVVLGAYLPLWYLEGDAVAVETALSSTGRGRQADFNMPLRAQLSEKGRYSYDKATMGSYRNFVPDHYILGYHLVTLAKKNYGDSIWENTESFIARNPYYIVPFSHSIRQHSGLRKKAFYEVSMDTLSDMWQRKTSNFISETIVENPTKRFTSYTYSQYVNDSVIFARKTGINEIGSFVLIYNDNGKQKEEKLFLPGYGSFYNISLLDSSLFWVEKRYHNRWQHLNYSVLMKYDFRTKNREQLTHKTRYYYPSYSPGAKTLVCVQQDVNGDYSLVVLSAEDGSIINEIDMPSFIRNPYFDKKGENIYFFILRNNGFELMEYTLLSNTQKSIISPSFNNLNRIIKNDSFIYFNDDISGVSNIFRKNLETNNVERITDVNFGVDAFSIWGNKLVFDDYTSLGWQASYVNLDSLQVYDNISLKHDLFKSYITKSGDNIQNETAYDSVFIVDKYSKASNLFNLHSWGPISIDVDNTNVNPGLSILSQNLLSTVELNMGYEYKLDELASKYFGNIDYKALPIVFSLRASYEDRRSDTPTDLQYKYGNSYTWNETSVGLYMYRGFRFNKNAFNYYIQPSMGMYYLSQGENNDTPTEVKDFLVDVFSMRYSIYASALRRTSYRDLQPRLGQSLKATYTHTPFGGNDLGDIFAIESNTYLPFITPHSGMKTYIGLQYINKNIYGYSNIIEMPRGLIGAYISSSDNLIVKQTIAIPLFYPDLSISSLAYIKRVKTYLFADYLYGEDIYSSIGADLRFDIHFLRTIAPVDIGFRTAFVTEKTISKQEVTFQLLLNISI